jgi:putative addiction module component (TIGR02574 family)
VNRVIDLDRLSARERLELVQELWDQLAEEPGQVPVTPAQQHELDRRLADHAATPNDVVAWDARRTRTRK